MCVRFSPMAGNVEDFAPRANEDRDRRRSWADRDGVEWGDAARIHSVAADQQVRRKAVTGRQTDHNLSHLGGITDLFTPIRFQRLGNSADRRLILREEFGRVLVRAGAPVCPHSAGFKGANLHPERGQFLGKRFRKAPNSPFSCVVRRAARSGQAAADRRYLEDTAAPLLAHVRYGRTGDVNETP